MGVLIFIIGLIFGSFYLVVATRLSNNESIVKPASHCTYCQHKLNWYELIPILSYVIQKGKCRHCQHKISILYPLVEIITAIVFLISYLLYGISYEMFAFMIIASLAIIIFITDFKDLIILDQPLVVSIILILVLKLIYFGLHPFLKSLLSGIFIFALLYLIKIWGDFAFKKESLGGGDIKLGIFIGVVLGIKLSLVAIVIASFTALPYASIYMIKKKDKEIPFGPFLILGVLLAFIFMTPISNFISGLFFA